MSTFRVETLIRLAAICETPPGRVLRAAGRADLADLLEEMYGKPDEAPARVRATAARYALFSREDQAIVETLVNRLAHDTAARRRAPPR